jgi:hypothetical protein
MSKYKTGKKSDDTLLAIIQEHQGLSQYELSRKLDWNIGKVDGSLRRLLREKKTIIRVLERNGRNVNLVYSSDYKPSNSIEIPINLLKVGNPLWLDSAYVYALDSSTIGISGKETDEWKDIACFKEKIPIQRTAEKVTLKIPEKVKSFYNMEKKHTVVSVNGNNLLITVSGSIIEEKKYPA